MLYLFLIEADNAVDLAFAATPEQALRLFRDFHKTHGVVSPVAARPERKRPGLVGRTGPLYQEIDLIKTLVHERDDALALAEGRQVEARKIRDELVAWLNGGM